MTSKTIWKYRLEILDKQEITMPVGAQILCAQMQGDQLYLWAIVDQKAMQDGRLIEIYGTGRLLPNLHPSHIRRYISTVQELSGQLVWHVFETI